MPNLRCKYCKRPTHKRRSSRVTEKLGRRLILGGIVIAVALVAKGYLEPAAWTAGVACLVGIYYAFLKTPEWVCTHCGVIFRGHAIAQRFRDGWATRRE